MTSAVEEVTKAFVQADPSQRTAALAAMLHVPTDNPKDMLSAVCRELGIPTDTLTKAALATLADSLAE